jgi:hypothetical protein
MAQHPIRTAEEPVRQCAPVETGRDPAMGLGSWIASLFEGKGLHFE